MKSFSLDTPTFPLNTQIKTWNKIGKWNIFNKKKFNKTLAPNLTIVICTTGSTNYKSTTKHGAMQNLSLYTDQRMIDHLYSEKLQSRNSYQLWIHSVLRISSRYLFKLHSISSDIGNRQTMISEFIWNMFEWTFIYDENMPEKYITFNILFSFVSHLNTVP